MELALEPNLCSKTCVLCPHSTEGGGGLPRGKKNHFTLTESAHRNEGTWMEEAANVSTNVHLMSPDPILPFVPEAKAALGWRWKKGFPCLLPKEPNVPMLPVSGEVGRWLISLFPPVPGSLQGECG